MRINTLFIMITLVMVNPLFAETWRTSRRAVVPQKSVQIVENEKPDVFIIDNNFPAPLQHSFQKTIIPLFDPNNYFEQELQLQKAAQQAAVLRSERISKLVQRIMELQTVKYNEPKKIKGNWNIGKLTTKYPMINKFCAKCHGYTGDSPAGGLIISDSKGDLLERNWFKITRVISSGRMPPASEVNQPSKEEKIKILNEIENIILNER